MKVLISSPRAGSTYYYQFIEEHNLTLSGVKVTGVDEFLNPDLYSHLTLDEKINWLIEERNKGINYTFKHHINYLKKDIDYYESWFKDFYKNDEIIVLLRKDTWAWFLSFLFQDCVNWKYAAISSNIDTSKLIKKIDSLSIEYDYKKTLKQFFEIKSQLDTVEGNIVYYEDLNFNNSRFKKLSSIVEYSNFFNNISNIKIDFDKLNN
jgi:hypothetical protein